MSKASETRKKNKLLKNIVEWQDERGLESWNDDVLKGEIGMRISEDQIISEDAPESEVEINFEPGNSENKYVFKEFTLNQVSPGQYHLSHN